MICPLMSTKPANINEGINCRKEKCAWWIEDRKYNGPGGNAVIVDYGKCAIIRLAEKK